MKPGPERILWDFPELEGWPTSHDDQTKDHPARARLLCSRRSQQRSCSPGDGACHFEVLFAIRCHAPRVRAFCSMECAARRLATHRGRRARDEGRVLFTAAAPRNDEQRSDLRWTSCSFLARGPPSGPGEAATRRASSSLPPSRARPRSSRSLHSRWWWSCGRGAMRKSGAGPAHPIHSAAAGTPSPA